MGLLDSMMETSLDDTEVAAEFLDFPNGEYRLEIVKAEAKEMEAKAATGDREAKPEGVRIAVTYSVLETIAVAVEGTEPVAVGSMNSESFNLNEQGMPYFKRYLVNVFGDTDGVSIGDLVRSLEGLQITCLVRNNSYNGRDFLATSRQAQV